MKTEKTVTCHPDSYVYATAIESIRHDKHAGQGDDAGHSAAADC